MARARAVQVVFLLVVGGLGGLAVLALLESSSLERDVGSSPERPDGPSIPTRSPNGISLPPTRPDHEPRQAPGQSDPEVDATGGASGGAAGGDLPLREELGSVAGRVIDARGAPIGGANVSVRPLDAETRLRVRGAKLSGLEATGSWGRDRAVTGPAGTYRLTGLPIGSYELRAASDAHLGAQRPVDLTGPVGGVDLLLEDGFTLEGVVTDTAGRAVSGATVEGRSPDAREPARKTSSGEDGQFSLKGLRPGVALVSAMADGFLPSDPRSFQLARGGQESVRLVLGLGATLEGRLTDTEGRAVAGATVFVMPMAAPDAAADEPPAASAAERLSVQANALGRYRVAGLAAGTYLVLVRAEALQGRAQATLAAGETRSLDLPLAKGGTLRGTVRTLAGDPLAGVRVEARLGGAVRRQGRSDDAGRFELTDLYDETYEVVLHDPKGRLIAEAASATVRNGLQLGEVTLVAHTGILLKGVVRGSDGAAAPRAYVLVVRNAARLGSGVSGSEGAYEIGGLVAGGADVYARSMDWAQVAHQRIEVPSSGDIQLALTLVPASFVEGSVTDEQGSSLGGVRVTVRHVAAKFGWGGEPVFTTGQGDFRVGPLAPGAHTLRAEHEGRRATLEVVVTPGPSTSPVTFQLRR